MNINTKSTKTYNPNKVTNELTKTSHVSQNRKLFKKFKNIPIITNNIHHKNYNFIKQPIISLQIYLLIIFNVLYSQTLPTNNLNLTKYIPIPQITY